MLVDGSYEILSCDDVELGIKRSSALSFYACYDDVKEAKALLVIIPGLGADSDSGYRAHLMREPWQRTMMWRVSVWIITV